jgi:hypothetical protein
MVIGIHNIAPGNPMNAFGRRFTDLERSFRELTAKLNQLGAPVNAGTSTLTSIPSSVTSVALLAANPLRLGAVLFNDSTAALYLSYGPSDASATSYTVKVDAGGSWTNDSPVYTGAITGIWTTANGACHVTELTA